jgi:hypothetical protein
VGAPLVLDDGEVVVLGGDGELFYVNPDGTERARVTLGPGPVSSLAAISDGTLVAATAAGEVFGVRDAAIVFRARVFGRAATRSEPAAPSPSTPLRPARPRLSAGARRAPPSPEAQDATATNVPRLLPLDDGGLAVALDHELACLDAQGSVRTRGTSSDPVATPLVTTGPGVAFASPTGEVYEWRIGAVSQPVVARGTFGSSVGASFAVLDDHHVVGVVESSRVVSLDLRTGETRTRLSGVGRTVAGALAIAPNTLFAMLVTGASGQVMALDREDHAAPFGPSITSSGGIDAGAVGPSTPAAEVRASLLIDPTGAVAYATPDGRVGVLTTTTRVEMGTPPCGSPAFGAPEAPRSRRASAVAAIVPAGAGAFVVACESGRVSLVRGDGG